MLSAHALEIPYLTRLAAARAVVADINEGNAKRGLAAWPKEHMEDQSKCLALGNWGGDLCDSTAVRTTDFLRVLCALGYRNNLASWEIPG